MLNNFFMKSELFSNLLNYISNNMLIISLVGAFSFIISVVCYCKIFKKAGQKWFKFLIPVYNIIVMCKIAGISVYNILFYIISFGLFMFIGYLASVVSNWMLVINIIPVVCFMYITFRLHIKLAYKFNRSSLFGVFLLIYPVNIILLLILAFSRKVAYAENKIIYKNNRVSESQVVNNIEVIENKEKICPTCNKKLNENAIYCTSCEKYID